MLYPTNAEPVVEEILNRITQLRNQKMKIVFIWIFSHIDVKTNDQTDNAVKRTFTLQQQDYPVSHKDLKCFFKIKAKRNQNQRWTNRPTTKLHSVRNNIYKPILPFHRRDHVILTRLKIGHTRIIHSHIFNKTSQEICSYCNSPYIVLHEFWDCAAL